MKKKLRNGPLLSRNRFRKLFITMKLTFIMTVCLVYGLSANVLSQQKISMNLKEATIKEVLNEFQRQTGTIVIYSSDKLETAKKVEAIYKDVDVESFLNTLLKGCNMSFRMLDDYILIVPQESSGTPQLKEISIKGKVVEKSGEAIPGVAVVIKGSSRGTATGLKGEYSLNIPEMENIILVFSFVGMKTQEVSYTGQAEINIVLEEDEVEMAEVVVTGMFTRQANTYTGAVTSINKETLLRGGNRDLLSSLANIEPSLLTIESLSDGSNPNASQNVILRGQSTIHDINNQYESDPSQPLFILDGFETTYQKIKDLDMNLVESVTILKDATAKAIYGAKAGNGVIVVELRRPEGGKIRISYNGSLDLEIPDLSSYNLTNAGEKLDAERLAGFYQAESVSSQIALDERYTSIKEEILAGVDTYWLSQPLRTGVGSKHSIYLEGGDEYMLYGIDLSYDNTKGAMKGSDRKTLSGGVSLSYRTEKLLFRNKLSVDHNVANDSPWGSFSLYAKMNPYNRLRDEHGEYIESYNYTYRQKEQQGSNIGEETNPIWNSMINTKIFSKYTDITENFYAEWNVNSRLKLTGRFGLTYKLSSSDDFKPATHTDFESYTSDEDIYRKGQYTKGEGKYLNMNADIGVGHSFTSGHHLIYSNVQFNLTNTTSDYYYMTAEGFPNDNMDHISFATQYLKDESPGGNENVSRTVGAVASVNYSYDNRYLADFNYRLSGSSETGNNKRWGHFWSVGGGWNLHQEKFLRQSELIERLKLRFSMGYTGSQGFNNYDAIATFKYYTTTSYNGNIGSYLMSLANPDLHWQKKYDQNIGLDFTLLHGKISGRFDYYWSTTKGMITNITLPQSTGFTTYRENLGETQNKGWEAYLNWRIWNSEDKMNFINVYASAAHNKNTLKKISNSLKSYNDSQDEYKNAEDNTSEKSKQTTPSVRYFEGESMNAIWAVKSLGIDPANGKEIYLKADGVTTTYRWNSADQVVCGDEMPKVNGSIGLNGEYKNIGLNVVMTFRIGGQTYNQTLVDKVENANISYNVDKRVLTDRWNSPGDIARFKSITDDTYTRPTSRFVEDYKLLKLASINLYYDFRDVKFVRDSFINRLRAVIYLNDIATISSVKNERGTSYPFARNISFSIQASF